MNLLVVNEDGKLVSRVNQKVDASQEGTENATPATHVRTEVEVPAQGIHRTEETGVSVERRNNVSNFEIFILYL